MQGLNEQCSPASYPRGTWGWLSSNCAGMRCKTCGCKACRSAGRRAASKSGTSDPHQPPPRSCTGGARGGSDADPLPANPGPVGWAPLVFGRGAGGLPNSRNSRNICTTSSFWYILEFWHRGGSFWLCALTTRLIFPKLTPTSLTTDVEKRAMQCMFSAIINSSYMHSYGFKFCTCLIFVLVGQSFELCVFQAL